MAKPKVSKRNILLEVAKLIGRTPQAGCTECIQSMRYSNVPNELFFDFLREHCEQIQQSKKTNKTKDAYPKPKGCKRIQGKCIQRKPIKRMIAKPKPVQQKPAERKPVQQKPIERKPVQKKPAERNLAQQKPAEQKPIQQKPIQQKQLQQKPIQQKPIQQKPDQRKLVQRKLVQRKLVQRKLVQRKLVQRKLVQRKLVQRKLVQPKLVQRKPMQRKLQRKFDHKARCKRFRKIKTNCVQKRKSMSYLKSFMQLKMTIMHSFRCPRCGAKPTEGHLGRVFANCADSLGKLEKIGGKQESVRPANETSPTPCVLKERTSYLYWLPGSNIQGNASLRQSYKKIALKKF